MASLDKVKKQMIVDTVIQYKREADMAKTSRTIQTKKNYDFYHLKQDFSHKLKGQSREFLPRQAMAVEQIAQFLHQGLVEQGGDTFSVQKAAGVKNPLFTSDEARKILAFELKKAGYFNFSLDAIKDALIQSVMIMKVHGEMVSNPKFRTKKDRENGGTKLIRSKDKSWQPKLSLVRGKNFYPDPTAEDLYAIEEIEIDFWRLKQIAQQNPERFDFGEMARLEQGLAGSQSLDDDQRARETNQNATGQGFRHRLRVQECWGNIIDMSNGKLLFERKVCLIANESFVIMPPSDYPSWLNRNPYVVAPLIRTPRSVWHKALMDAPTWLNQALNEIFNLIIDGGLQAVFGIKQIREHYLENPAQISGGIFAGDTLSVNQSAPPGTKVLERVDTGTTASEAVNAFNLASGEFNSSALQNDLRTGTLPPRAVKATEVVEASQSITSVFTGVGKSIEVAGIEPLLEKVWSDIIQNFSKIDKEEMISILGKNRYEQLIKLTDEQRFARSANGFKFRVFGITQTINKIKDLRKLTTLLQTLGTNPTLLEAFIKNHDMSKLLTVIMKALDIDVDAIKNDKVDSDMNALPGAEEAEPGLENVANGADVGSQIPDANAGRFGTEPGQLPGDQLGQSIEG